jgi:hypothetical protein
MMSLHISILAGDAFAMRFCGVVDETNNAWIHVHKAPPCHTLLEYTSIPTGRNPLWQRANDVLLLSHRYNDCIVAVSGIGP